MKEIRSSAYKGTLKAIATLSEESVSVDKIYLRKIVSSGGPISEDITSTRRNRAIFYQEFFGTNMHRVIDLSFKISKPWLKSQLHEEGACV